MDKRKIRKAKIKKAPIKTVAKIASKNEVVLLGRVSSIQGERELPSGDKVSEFRIVVSRGSRKTQIDVIDIAAWKAPLRKRLKSLKVDNWVQVEGALRRRFWQGSNGVSNRWQVECEKLMLF